jgi:hypothetical protein
MIEGKESLDVQVCVFEHEIVQPLSIPFPLVDGSVAVHGVTLRVMVRYEE